MGVCGLCRTARTWVAEESRLGLRAADFCPHSLATHGMGPPGPFLTSKRWSFFREIGQRQRRRGGERRKLPPYHLLRRKSSFFFLRLFFFFKLQPRNDTCYRLIFTFPPWFSKEYHHFNPNKHGARLFLPLLIYSRFSSVFFSNDAFSCSSGLLSVSIVAKGSVRSTLYSDVKLSHCLDSE